MARILIIGTAHPYRGGLATFNERLAKQLVDEGHQVEVWTFTLQYPSFLFPGKTQYTSDPAPEGLTIRRRLNSCNPFSWWKVAREAAAMQPDILICCYWMAFFAPAYALISKMVKRNGHTRTIALVHNLYAHEPSILDRLLVPAFIKSQDAFVTLSKSVAEHLRELSKGKPVATNPHPIYDHYGARLSKEEACGHLGLDSKKSYILFFGLVRAYKGLDLLLDALAMMKTKPQLLIAGEFYEDEEKYRAQIAANGLTDNVVIRNEFIPDEDIKYYFGAADLIVQPYKSATQSGVTQVAFHFEKPILVTNVGGLGEIVHHCEMGYAVEPEAKAIADCITDYFENDREAPFTDAVRQEKNKYSWDKLTKAFFSV